MRTLAAGQTRPAGSPNDTSPPGQPFTLELAQQDAWGLTKPTYTVAFGLVDSAVTSWSSPTRTESGAATFSWSMRTRTAHLIVDTGHLRRIELVAGRMRRVALDAWLDPPTSEGAPPPLAELSAQYPGDGLSHRDMLCETAETGVTFWSQIDEVVEVADADTRVGSITGTVRNVHGRVPYESFVQAVGDARWQGAGPTNFGSYGLRGLPYGRYHVTARCSDGGIATTEVVVDRPETVIDLDVSAPIRVRGHVVDIDGTPIAEARILWQTDDGDWRNRAITRVDGTFAIHDIRIIPGSVWVCASRDGARLPAVGVRGVVPDGGDVVLTLDRSRCNGKLRVEPLLPRDVDIDLLSVRVWQHDSGLGVRMTLGDQAAVFAIDDLAAGHYDIEVVYPGLGVTRSGPYWLDGRNEVRVTDIALPEPGRITFTGDAPPKWELVHHRPDIDLRIVTGAPFAGPHLLRAGDYTLLWRDAGGAVRQRTFRVDAGIRQSLSRR